MGRYTRWNGSAEAQRQYEAARATMRQRRKKTKKEKRAAKAAKPSHGYRLPHRAWVAIYSEYLKSAWWKARRQKAIDKAGAKCERCGSRIKLECHHTSYSRLYRERDSDLEVLCHDCHSDHHLAEVFGVSVEGLREYMNTRAADGVGGMNYKRGDE